MKLSHPIVIKHFIWDQICSSRPFPLWTHYHSLNAVDVNRAIQIHSVLSDARWPCGGSASATGCAHPFSSFTRAFPHMKHPNWQIPLIWLGQGKKGTSPIYSFLNRATGHLTGKRAFYCPQQIRSKQTGQFTRSFMVTDAVLTDGSSRREVNLSFPLCQSSIRPFCLA